MIFAARVRALWPAYVLGAFPCTIAATKIEKWTWSGPGGFQTMALILAGVILVLEVVGRRRGRTWSVHSREELADDDRDVAVLDIGCVVHGAHVGG